MEYHVDTAGNGHLAILTRDQILQANDMQQEVVPVPEWGGAVIVRSLSGAERDQFEASIMERRGKRYDLVMADMRAKFVALSVVDEQGRRIFSAADVARLTQKSAAALQRVFNVGQRLSGLTDEDMEELAKNSAPGQSDDSTFA